MKKNVEELVGEESVITNIKPKKMRLKKISILILLIIAIAGV